jgi:glycosyltransferase involved in cell wall biosynthesis
MSFYNEKIKKINLKFSVSMCVYKNDNHVHFKEALESVFNQTLKPDEVVLVIDGPIPNPTDEVINNYENETSLKVIRLPENVGHGNARRIGLENCSNELIALMDADDISVTDRFEKQVKCFEENENISIIGGNIKEFINSVNNIVGIRNVPQNDNEIKHYMKKRCPFNQMTVMFKLSEVNKAGGYRDWYHNEDYYLWLRMYQSGATFMNLKDALVLVRVGNEMYGRRGGWKYFISEAKLQIYMFNHGITNVVTLLKNILIRFILQVLMPNKLRGLIFRKFARQKV